jgi:hypothetical protein
MGLKFLSAGRHEVICRRRIVPSKGPLVSFNRRLILLENFLLPGFANISLVHWLDRDSIFEGSVGRG